MPNENAKESRENPVHPGKNGGTLNSGGVYPHAGAPRGKRWSTLINEAMEAMAPDDWKEEPVKMGIATQGEPISIRKAMVAKAIARYMLGKSRIVGGEENPFVLHEDEGDPKILGLLMDREEGKSTITLANDPENPLGFTVIGSKELEDI